MPRHTASQPEMPGTFDKPQHQKDSNISSPGKGKMKLLLIYSYIRKVQKHGEVKLSGLHLKSLKEVASLFEPETSVQVDPDAMRAQ